MDVSFWELLVKPPYVYLLAFGLILMLAGMIIRVATGAVSQIPAAVSASFAIVFIYIVAIAAYGTDAHMDIFVTALPFWGEVSDATQIFGLMQGNFSTFVIETAHMLMLAIIVNIFQKIAELLAKPNNRTLFVRFLIWYLVQSITVILSLAVNAILTHLIRQYIPADISRWVPLILAGILTLLMILVAVKVIFSLANPFLGALFDFFMGNTVGRILTKSFLTTAGIAVFVYIAQRYGWFRPLLESGILVNSFGPVLLIFILLWYVVWFFI